MTLTKKLRKLKNDCHNVCQLCGVEVNGLFCDHDHMTELVRGFVCRDCNNFVLPAAERKPELVTGKVLRYLNCPPLKEHKIKYKNQKPLKMPLKPLSEIAYETDMDLYHKLRAFGLNPKIPARRR